MASVCTFIRILGLDSDGVQFMPPGKPTGAPVRNA